MQTQLSKDKLAAQNITMSFVRVRKVKYYADLIIGRGSFGIVYSGNLRRGIYGGNNEPIAVKRVERGRVDESAIQREVELMVKANDHPNILRYCCTEMNNDFLYYDIYTYFNYCTSSNDLHSLMFK